MYQHHPQPVPAFVQRALASPQDEIEIAALSTGLSTDITAGQFWTAVAFVARFLEARAAHVDPTAAQRWE